MMSAVALQMSCVAALLALAAMAIVLSRFKRASEMIYGLTMAVCIVAAAAALVWLVWGEANTSALILPIGLPWIGAHFRLDAWPRSSSSWSISAAPPRASTASATAGTSTRRNACCRSFRRSWPA